MTETQKHLPTPDSERRVVRKNYAEQKRLPKRPPGHRLFISEYTFKKDLHIFDPEMAAKYSNAEVVAILRACFKAAANKIVKELWRMPFPNQIGSLYMKEAQVSRIGESTGGKIVTDHQIELLLRECRLGMKRVFLKWNKQGRNFPFKNVWTVKRSNGYFRSLLFDEIIDRAEDPTRKNYRGHII